MPLWLHLMRHAKAEDLAEGGDHARPLRGRGRKAARQAGRLLGALDRRPERVLSSTAARALETAELVCAPGGLTCAVEPRRELYEATPETLLELLRGLDGNAERVLVVGHQPSLSLLIERLIGHEPDFPTAAVARLDLDLERWSEIAPRKASLAWLVTPEITGALRAREP